YAATSACAGRPASSGGLDQVPHAAHRVDHRRLAGIDLLAQVGDVDLDDARAAAEVVAPHPVEDLRLAHDPARVAHEEAKEFELRRRKFNRPVTTAHLVALLVEREIAHPQDRVGRLGDHERRATDEPAQSRHELLEAERLRDVVVSPSGQAGDVGQHDVEHDDIRPELPDDRQCAVAVCGGAHVPALVAQGHADEVAQRGLVVDDDHAQRGAIGPQQLRGGRRAGCAISRIDSHGDYSAPGRLEIPMSRPNHRCESNTTLLRFAAGSYAFHSFFRDRVAMQLSKRTIVNSSLGIVVVGALVGAYFVINPPSASTASSDTQLTATVQQGTVSNTITASGTVAPAREVSASFAVSGTIATVAVTLGQTVAAGDLLGTLDTTALQRTVNEDQTQLNNAIASLSDAKAD